MKDRGELPGPKFPVWLRIPWPGNSRETHNVFWMLHMKEADENMPRFEAFRATIEGPATPLEFLLPIFSKESARKPRQEADCERAIKKLIKFMVEHDRPTTIEHLTRRMVGEWVSSRVKLGHHWKTLNKDISFCSGLFKYAMRRGLIEMNPFSLQSLPKLGRT